MTTQPLHQVKSDKEYTLEEVKDGPSISRDTWLVNMYPESYMEKNKSFTKFEVEPKALSRYGINNFIIVCRQFLDQKSTTPLYDTQQQLQQQITSIPATLTLWVKDRTRWLRIRNPIQEMVHLRYPQISLQSKHRGRKREEDEQLKRPFFPLVMRVCPSYFKGCNNIKEPELWLQIQLELEESNTSLSNVVRLPFRTVHKRTGARPKEQQDMLHTISTQQHPPLVSAISSLDEAPRLTEASLSSPLLHQRPITIPPLPLSNGNMNMPGMLKPNWMSLSLNLSGNNNTGPPLSNSYSSSGSSLNLPYSNPYNGRALHYSASGEGHSETHSPEWQTQRPYATEEETPIIPSLQRLHEEFFDLPLEQKSFWENQHYNGHLPNYSWAPRFPLYFKRETTNPFDHVTKKRKLADSQT